MKWPSSPVTGLFIRYTTVHPFSRNFFLFRPILLSPCSRRQNPSRRGLFRLTKILPSDTDRPLPVLSTPVSVTFRDTTFVRTTQTPGRSFGPTGLTPWVPSRSFTVPSLPSPNVRHFYSRNVKWLTPPSETSQTPSPHYSRPKPRLSKEDQRDHSYLTSPIPPTLFPNAPPPLFLPV